MDSVEEEEEPLVVSKPAKVVKKKVADKPAKTPKTDDLEKHPWEANSSFAPSVTQGLRSILWEITSDEKKELWKKEKGFTTCQPKEDDGSPFCIACGPLSAASIAKERVRVQIHPSRRADSMFGQRKMHPMFDPTFDN